MSSPIIDKLIICNPYEEPKNYWEYNRESQGFEKKTGRRKSGIVKASRGSAGKFDDPGEFYEFKTVNEIRLRVKDWKYKGYRNATQVTKDLLEFWNNNQEREQPFFWCQLEAIETLIWLNESDSSERQGLNFYDNESNLWIRECVKLATGTGKTVVMAMTIAWQILNKITYPKDQRFSKNILIVSPNITVKDRLNVLLPENKNNYYQGYNIVNSNDWQKINLGNILVQNWHNFYELNDGEKSVVKRGIESDEAFFKRLFPDFGNSKNILVINDEAHHCHRFTVQKKNDLDADRSTIWISGLDKINSSRGILKTYDFTATPYYPATKEKDDEQYFKWIVSDFGLYDAIESGLVKTPKAAVRDDSSVTEDFKSKLFHIYPEVKDDLNRKAQNHEGLPDLVNNAFNLLGADWLAEKTNWEKQDNPRPTPPVLIVICNRTETSSRIEYSIKNGFFSIPELNDHEKLIRIDQNALLNIESQSEMKKKDLVSFEREKFNTVGKVGKIGQRVQCVIGVDMLSEGWDAQTVTHILGLRAFTSQLLCEQVVGRGLRRISYDINNENLLDPEYVTVFGIPFTFLPIEGGETVRKPEKPKTKVEAVLERESMEIKWPHVLRLDYNLNYFLDLDWEKMEELSLSADDCQTLVETAPIVSGKPKLDLISEINLEKLNEVHRLQKLKLQAAARIHFELKDQWKADTGSQISQTLNLFDQFVSSKYLKIISPNSENKEKINRLVIALNAQKIVNHLIKFIKKSSVNIPKLYLDPVKKIRSTMDMKTFFTSKPTMPIKKSNISHAVIDNSLNYEGRLCVELERSRIPNLISWFKNDRIGFEIFYTHKGKMRTYYPDFVLKFEDNKYLIIETKGQIKDLDSSKWEAIKEWTKAVNYSKEFGQWYFLIIQDIKNIFDEIYKFKF
jgi:type III restriction enzyme